MKQMYLALLTLCILSFKISAQSNVVSERVVEEVEMRIPASELTQETIFHFNNINGDLHVEGYSGDEILITGTKVITGKPNIISSFNPDELYLDKLSKKRHLFVFVRHPGLDIKIEGNELNYRSNKKDFWEDKIQGFEFNLQMKVPHSLMSEISTINAGEVVVVGLRNGVEATNINGRVIIKNITGEIIKAVTVNGNVKAVFDETPLTDVELGTVNGNIELLASKKFSANVTFKSLHGELYTDFNDESYRSDKSVKKDGINRFGIGNTEVIQIGQGGPNIQLRLLNGNAYIQQL